jgi:predicted N-acyltransferase
MFLWIKQVFDFLLMNVIIYVKVHSQGMFIFSFLYIIIIWIKHVEVEVCEVFNWGKNI